jgi:RNA polymerase sigma factor (sigma-70 family)
MDTNGLNALILQNIGMIRRIVRLAIAEAGLRVRREDVEDLVQDIVVDLSQGMPDSQKPHHHQWLHETAVRIAADFIARLGRDEEVRFDGILNVGGTSQEDDETAWVMDVIVDDVEVSPMGRWAKGEPDTAAFVDVPDLDGSRPDEIVRYLELRGRVEGILQAAPARVRDAFDMLAIDGLTIPEIAKCQRCRQGHVANRLRIARWRLRRSRVIRDCL